MIDIKTIEDVPVGSFYKFGFVFSEIIAVKESDNPFAAEGSGRVVVPNLGSWGTCVDIYSVRPGCDSVYSADYVDKLSDPEFTVRRAKDCNLLANTKYGTPTEVGLSFLESSNYSQSDSPVSRFLITRDDFPTTAVRFAIGLYKPYREVTGGVSIYRNAVDAKRNRRTTLKAGRAFRHMFPDAEDKQIAALTEAWIENSMPRDLTLKVGRSVEDFTRAYDHDRASFRNPTQTSLRKSIASSCMQGVGRDYRNEVGRQAYASVGAAYASGDFEIAWVEDKDGLIAGRVVYSAVEGHTNTSGPIYGACEQSLDMLQAHIVSKEIEDDVEEWEGLRLKVVGPVDDPVVPYLDGDLGGRVTSDGKFIELCSSGYGEFNFDSTDGSTSPSTGCDCCGSSYTLDDLYNTDDGLYCECCFNDNYTYLECGTVVDREYAVVAYTYVGNNRSTEVVLHIDDAVYCEEYDEYWDLESVTIDDEGVARPTHLIPDQLELDLEEAA